MQKEDKKYSDWKKWTKFRLELYLSFYHNTTTIWFNWCVLGMGDCGEEDGKIKTFCLVIVPSYVLSFPPRSVPGNTALTAHGWLTRQAQTHFPILEISASKRTNNMTPFHLHFNWTYKWNLQTRMINCISWLDSTSELHLQNADYVSLLKLIWVFL